MGPTNDLKDRRWLRASLNDQQHARRWSVHDAQDANTYSVLGHLSFLLRRRKESTTPVI